MSNREPNSALSPSQETLFNPDTNAAMVERILSLPPDARPLWGKMSVAQMLAHCQRPILHAFGRISLKRSLLGILFGRIAKRRLFRPVPFPHNLPTDPHFVASHDPAFEAERSQLIELVRLFLSPGREGLSSESHPFFGPMTYDEMEWLQRHHLDHHLRQFGR